MQVNAAWITRSAIAFTLFLCMVGLGTTTLRAQDASPSQVSVAPDGVSQAADETAVEQTADTSLTVPITTDDGADLVTVNWFEELMHGGATMWALGALSVAMLAFAIERLIVLRRQKFVPLGLARKVEPMFLAGDHEGVLAACRAKPGTLSRVVSYLVEHRDADPQLLAQAAGDLGARDIIDQEQRCTPFAVIAALAPLLGLLGTMIGMIQAFKMVKVYGDEGGASMLAGSISKALITTAVGLILAIPAIALYHAFKHRVHVITQQLERETDGLFSAWFITKRDRQIVKQNGDD